MNKKEIENNLNNMSKKEVVNLISELYEKTKKTTVGLVWEDQPEDIAELMEKSIPYLEFDEKRSIIGKSINNNLLVEADNYELLKILKQTHERKIDVIYIDPPYNRGGDYAYNDKKINETDEWKHSKWLSFMNKRLRLAYDLLKDEGVMFISIDDVEHSQLRMLCNQICGYDKVESYVWYLNDKTEGSFEKTPSNTVRVEHEYIIACYKGTPSLKKYSAVRMLSNECGNPDDDPRGPWFSANISRNGITSTTGSKYYTITTPTGKEYTRNWTLSKEEYEEKLKNNEIFFANGGDGVPREKKFINVPSLNVQSSVFGDVHTSITGKNQLKEVLELSPREEEPFKFPKPTDLIKRLITIGSTDPNAIILDFFAGSGTTGQAVMELNQQDNGSRRFILCTNNEVEEEKELNYFIENKIQPEIPTSKRSREYKEYMNNYEQFKASDKYKEEIQKEKYKEMGICRAITWKRLSNFINGYKFKGNKKTELYKTKIELKDIKNYFEEINTNMKLCIEKNKNDYQSIKTEYKNNIIYINGYNEVEEITKGVDENLLYYRINLLEKSFDENETKDLYLSKIDTFIKLKEDVYEIENKNKNYYTISSMDKCVYIYPEIIVKEEDMKKIASEINRGKTNKIYVRSENARDINVANLNIEIGQIPDDFMKGVNV